MEFYKIMPKIELHLHMEGAIPYSALFQLIQKYGGNEEIKSPENLEHRFIFKNFAHFIEQWVWKNQFIREYEDFRFIAENVAKDLKRQNVKYAEMFISPSDFKKCGLYCQKIIEEVYKGISAVSGIDISLIIDLVRDFGADNALKTLNEINEMKKFGIIGIGLGGSEHEYPPELFSEVFETARNMGFKTTVHSGEACGAESVKKAVEFLKPDRIGHAVNAAYDNALLKKIAELKIPVELCPISNIKTGAIKSAEFYPIEKFIEYGIPFSINTDDPKMFGNSLADEYMLIEKKLGCGHTGMANFILNSIDTTWLSKDKKDALKICFKEEYSRVSKTQYDNQDRSRP
ncbi:MAG: adenosine deaminase [Candidatus Wallbacteria bacterium]